MVFQIPCLLTDCLLSIIYLSNVDWHTVLVVLSIFVFAWDGCLACSCPFLVNVLYLTPAPRWSTLSHVVGSGCTLVAFWVEDCHFQVFSPGLQLLSQQDIFSLGMFLSILVFWFFNSCHILSSFFLLYSLYSLACVLSLFDVSPFTSFMKDCVSLFWLDSLNLRKRIGGD